MNTPGAIRVEGVWKRYGLPLSAVAQALKRRLRGASAGGGEGDLWALQDLSFAIEPGETFGIIGRNGAGKSTLLKVLAGVTPPTRGQVEIAGRIFPMIELNAGMHAELTGRENVYLLGAIMGFSRAEMDSRIEEIREFTELAEWFDRPVRQYSSGMLARLGFGVAINVEAEVLLIDEVLAVGDRAFQNKCLARLYQMRRDGRTKLFVSHNLDQVQYLCRRAVLLERGQVVFLGDSEEAIRLYEQRTFLNPAFAAKPGRARSLNLGVEVESVRVNGREAAGAAEVPVPQDEPFRLEVRAQFQREYLQSTPLFACTNNEGIPIWMVYASEHGLPAADFPAGTYRFALDLPPLHLREGRYFLHFGLRSVVTLETFERQANVASFAVAGGDVRQRAEFILAPPARCEFAKE